VGGAVLGFIGWLIYKLQKPLLSIYVEKKKKEIEVMDKAIKAIDKTGDAMEAHTRTLDTIRVSCETNLTETRTVNGTLEVVKEKIDTVKDIILRPPTAPQH
jgi:mevalonate kinase